MNRLNKVAARLEVIEAFLRGELSIEEARRRIAVIKRDPKRERIRARLDAIEEMLTERANDD